jgi:hypothetical protein
MVNIKQRVLNQWIGYIACVMFCMWVIPVYSASYLMISDLGSSAEMIRRGNIEGFSSGSNAIFENPASLYRVDRISTSVFQSKIMTEVEYRNISLAVKTDFGVIGVGYMDAGVEGIQRTTKDSGSGLIAPTGEVFGYKNRIIKVGYQKSISKEFHLGLSGVGYINEIDTYLGSGYSLDFGGIYQFNDLTVSLFARNIIPTKVKYSDSNADNASYSGEEVLPLQTVFGIAYPFGDLDVMGQFKFDGTNSLMSGGLDYTPHFLWNALTLSVGYKEFSILDKTSNTVTMGVGLNLFGLSIDYAYEKSDHFEYDANSFASVGFDF